MNSRHWRWSTKQLQAIALLMLLALTATTVHAVNFPLTITANNITKTYGTPITFVTSPPIPPAVIPLPDYTVTGSLQAGDTVNSVTLTSDGAPAAAPLAGSPYPIVPSAAAMTITSGNTYTITYVNGALTVNPTAATLADPAYRKPILLPQSQVSAIWTNLIPNALADYYTYVPFKNADAVALGFPSSCGNPAAVGATAADLASTEDCYSISVKKFQQAMSLPTAWGFGGNGLLNPNAANAPFGAITWAQGYGSGGAGWVLPYYDTTKPGVVAGTPVTGNAPPPFTNGTIATTGLWHFPAPSIKGSKGRPVRVQWLNELPNEKQTNFDPTLCGNDPADCYPYNRIVTHVHGAHVGPESDGMVHAWFSPAFALKGPLWESTRQFGPEGTYYYPMDQEAGTIWYHDHSTGLTHNNTNMGMAGFFPVTDANEKLLQANNILPTGAHELGFALQDRVFYNDGQLAMPDAPVLNPAFAATCTYLPPDPVTGDILVTSAASACSPVFMKAPDGHLVPYPAVPGVPAPAAYLATSATLEFFGNMPVVNGVTYGKYNVDRGVYRLRFLGGTDSRTWALRLKVAGSNPARYLPFWQIGSEQGLLNNPAKRDNLLIMPGERVDVLVDFNSAEVLDAAGVSAGPLNLSNTRIIVENWAGDVPYGGKIILPPSDPGAMAFRSADIPELMAFDVSAVIVAGGTLTPSAATALRPSVPAIPSLTTTPPPVTTPVRTVSLVEITDIYQRIMPTIDGRGFMDYGVSELPKLNTTEQWDIVNTTVDAHPMHLHQVAFQLINRETIASTCPTSLLPPLCVTPASTALVPPYTSPVVTAYQPLSIETPLPHEIGYKDTILCPPGKVTRIIATFDIPGAYVWHCHILSHEEHDMMRPMVVTTPAASVTLTAANLAQPTGVTMTPVALTAQAFTGIATHPVGSGFEYDFTVAGPTHAPLLNPPQPTRAMPSFASSLGDTYNVVKEASWTPPATPGTYVITAGTKAMGAVGAGNPIVTTTLNYTVTNATITIDPASLAATYNGTPKAVTVLAPVGLTVNVTYNGSITPPTNAGSYNVVATASDPANTSFAATSATLVINPAPITISANSTSRAYGAANPVNPGFTVTSGILAAGDSVTSVTYTYQATATATALVGSTHTITPSAAVFGTGLASNYVITYAAGTLSIAAMPITITANNASRFYGDVNPAAPGFTITSGVLSAGDSIGSVSYTYQATATATAVAGTTHTITPSAAIFATGSAANYTITYAGGLLTISKAPLTITANNRTKAYGTAVTFTGSEFTATGLRNTDTVTSVLLTSTGAAGNATVAGSPYPIVPNTVFGTGLTNYTITRVNGAMTVIKATPVITWATPAAIPYGTAISNIQLNAAANVPGTFVYNPIAGTVINTSSRLLSVAFTPTDSANYNSVTTTVNQVTVAGTTAVAKISTGPAYSSIQAAYNAVLNGDVIKVMGTTITGAFTANKPLTTVTLKGGHDSLFVPVPGSMTTIKGTVTLQQGTLIMDSIIVN